MTNFIDIDQVDAFTQTPFCGNPAGVVLAAEAIDAELRQKIAREMNCSETVFIDGVKQGSFRFQYFTPETEVDLCGHATIAALHILQERLALTGELTVLTNVGWLPMRIETDGTVWMQQAHPAFRDLEESTRTAIVAALGATSAEVAASLPFQLAYTGLWDILVPLKSREILNRLEPKFDQIAAISKQLGAASVHVYTLDPVDPGATVHARDFSPAVGVNEDPHTGTANGALAALLVQQAVLPPGRYMFEQGWRIGRPGDIWTEVTPELTVSVGGKAVITLSGQLRVHG